MSKARKLTPSLVPRTLLWFSVLGLLAACGDVGYYAQCVGGQLSLMAKREPINRVLAAPGTAPELRSHLEKVLAIRDFASSELLLPDNGSYRSYADLGRPYAVWNVVATPEFSLTPQQWCFPVAGCVSYRGYFSLKGAKRFAEKLKGEGVDVYLYGVDAYSTLNWFDDPVLNTFSRRPEANLAGLIFHELAHQQLYVRGDSSFNEAFAKTVELEGVERWLRLNGNEEARRLYGEAYRREEEFVHLLHQVRDRLLALYASPLDREAMQSGKERLFAELREEYGQLKESWGGFTGYDSWFKGDLNNARLVSVGTYRDLVPVFRLLLRQEGGDLAAFYRRAAAIGQLAPPQRTALLGKLLAGARKEKVAAGGKKILRSY
jgi:predicted aminopeptidase